MATHKQTGTLWIDLTHLLEWEGRFTGIERVEYQLASHTANDPAVNAKFFEYDRHERAFHEISNDVLSKLEGGFGLGGQRPKAPSKRPLLTRLRRRIERQVMPQATPSTGHAISGPFASEDTVFVGSTLSTHEYIQDLCQLKQKADFSLVHLIHDLIPIINPAFVPDGTDEYFTRYYETVLAHADQLLSVSESTKRDILAFANQRGLDSPPISTIRLGDAITSVQPTRPPALTIERFILCVGTQEVRKNHAILYYAYRLADEQGVDLPPLVIVGRSGWLAGDFRRMMATDPVVSKQIVFLEGISDRELAWLYTNCLFTVFPSFYEGWGLPIAESMQFGKAVLSSKTSSMQEIAGDLAEYVSPYDSQQVLDGIMRLSADDYRSVVEKRIRKTYKVTDWDGTYHDFISAIRSMKKEE